MQSYAAPSRERTAERAAKTRAQVVAATIVSTLPLLALGFAMLDSVTLYVSAKLLAGLGAP